MTITSGSARRPAGAARPRLTRARLSLIAAGTAAHPDRWRDLVRYDPSRRWYRRLEITDEYEVWLLSWQPGQGTGFHDHGGSAGAFAAADGESRGITVRGSGRRPAAARAVAAGQVRSSGARFVHDVLNNSPDPAISVPAYSPLLPRMRRYELTADGLRYAWTEPPGQRW